MRQADSTTQAGMPAEAGAIPMPPEPPPRRPGRKPQPSPAAQLATARRAAEELQAALIGRAGTEAMVDILIAEMAPLFRALNGQEIGGGA